MRTAPSLLLSALLSVITLPALAADPTATPGIDQRLQDQEQRIQQGVQSGALTGKEAAKLERKEQNIRRMEAKVKADGTVTPQERRKLRHLEDQQNRRIYREKHDNQVASNKWDRRNNEEAQEHRRNEERQEHRANRLEHGRR